MVTKNKLLTAVAIGSLCLSGQVRAAEIERNTAQMQAMDKITGRVSVIEVPVNSEVAFGSFSIVVRACKSTPPEETPENYAFVDVADSSFGKMQFNIFKGWMMSSSPALNAVEHPIYDVWLLKCIDTEVDKSKLLSEEQLKERDALPKLADIKQKNNDEKAAETQVQPVVTPEETQKPEMSAEGAEGEKASEDKVLKDFTEPAVLEEQVSEDTTQPLSEVSTEDAEKDAAETTAEEKQDGPQSLLNIGQPADTDTVTPPTTEPAAAPASEWVELPPSGEAQKQLPENAAPLIVPDVAASETSEAEVDVQQAPEKEAASLQAAEEEGNIPPSLPEDEEDQFIDLSGEADATAALEAELSAEALKE